MKQFKPLCVQFTINFFPTSYKICFTATRQIGCTYIDIKAISPKHAVCPDQRSALWESLCAPRASTWYHVTQFGAFHWHIRVTFTKIKTNKLIPN